VAPEPEVSLPRLREAATGAFPEPHEFTLLPFSQSSQDRCYSHPLSAARSSEWSLSFLLFHQTLYTDLSSPTRTTCPAQLIPLYLICLMISGIEYKLWSSPLCNFLHSPITSSLLVLNILVTTLSSNTLSLCSCLNMRDHVSHPYKTTDRIVVLCFLT
jgi:hypothetical protein